MRTRTFVLGALLLASAGLAQAQEQQQTTGQTVPTMATPASSFQPKFGKVDFGFRAEDLSGDEARYNRFRDTRDGAYLSRFTFGKETDSTLFRAEANNVGWLAWSIGDRDETSAALRPGAPVSGWTDADLTDNGRLLRARLRAAAAAEGR